MKRIFLAISFHNNSCLHEVVKNVKSELRSENIAWVDEKNLHLTLKFFGPTGDLLINRIKERLDEAFEDQKKISVSFQFLKIFGSRYQPRVLWMGMQNPEPIISLEKSIRKALEECGVKYDRQNFVPHLTFGRIKKLNSRKYFQSIVDKYKTFDTEDIHVGSVFLYQSILTNDGPMYKVLKEFKFK